MWIPRPSAYASLFPSHQRLPSSSEQASLFSPPRSPLGPLSDPGPPKTLSLSLSTERPLTHSLQRKRKPHALCAALPFSVTDAHPAPVNSSGLTTVHPRSCLSCPLAVPSCAVPPYQEIHTSSAQTPLPHLPSTAFSCPSLPALLSHFSIHHFNQLRLSKPPNETSS